MTSIMIDSLQNTRLNSFWTQGDSPPQTDAEGLQNALYSLSQPFVLVDQNGQPAAARGGSLSIELSGNLKSADPLPDTAVSGIRRPVLAFTPSLRPEDLGDPEFKKRHHLRYAYVGGAMANGITSTAMVEAMGKAGMMAFYGAAGLTLAEVEKAISRSTAEAGGFPLWVQPDSQPRRPGSGRRAGRPLHQTRHSKGLRFRLSESDVRPGPLPGFRDLPGRPGKHRLPQSGGCQSFPGRSRPEIFFSPAGKVSGATAGG